MEDGVLVHGRGEEESVGEVSRMIENLIRSELIGREFSAGEGSENIFGAEPYLITGSELPSPPPVPELAVQNSWRDQEGSPVPCVFVHRASSAVSQ